ncbi:MAG: type II secretion system protein [Phycisphaeraceae bacterium]|nr:type II secretion system protein [Phycisphaeraceae bacterium]
MIQRRGGFRGFTLIELLVVISIIGLLMSILLPTLSHARDRGRATICASNIHQLATTSLQFADDDSQHRSPGSSMPVIPAQLGVVNPAGSWRHTLDHYLNVEQIATCPSDRDSPHWSIERPDMPGHFRKTSYGINAHVSNPATNAGLWPPTPMFDGNVLALPRPSKTLAFGETSETGLTAIGDFISAAGFGTPAQYGAYAWIIAADRHDQRPQYSFWDGHAEPAALEDVYDSGTYTGSGTGEWTRNKFHPMIAR